MKLGLCLLPKQEVKQIQTLRKPCPHCGAVQDVSKVNTRADAYLCYLCGEKVFTEVEDEDDHS